MQIEELNFNIRLLLTRERGRLGSQYKKNLTIISQEKVAETERGPEA
jgi:hypothetical protein